jgi:SAM-dependent methyltransferase
MIQLPKDYAINQRRFTSNSRGTKAGQRVERNVKKYIKYLRPPILSIGCGDGYELEQIAIYNKHILEINKAMLGIEVAKDRVLYAKNKKNLPVIEGVVENLPEIIKTEYGYDKKFNIYCAHTLEHTFDLDLAINNIKLVCLDNVVIIVPIELSGKSGNASHHNPISNLGIIANKFGIDWTLKLAYNFDQELQGIVVLRRRPVNWPKGHRAMSGDLVIQDPGELSIV